MPSNSFCNDGCEQKAGIVELKYRPGREAGLAYILPPKFLALERGGGKKFLEETSFIRTGSEDMPPPSPFLFNPAIQAIQDKVDLIKSQMILPYNKLNKLCLTMIGSIIQYIFRFYVRN